MSSGSAAVRAASAARPTERRAPRAASTLRSRTSPVRSSKRVRPRPSSCSRSFITSSVCWRPSVNSACPSCVASSRVIRPRLTTSSSASSIRERLIMTISSGRIRLVVRACRNSATLLPANSPVAADAAVRACFCAFCCRPRAWPPFFAARLRGADELVFFAAVVFRVELFLAELLRPELFFELLFFSARSVSLPRDRAGLLHVEGRDDDRLVRQAHSLRIADGNLAAFDGQLARRVHHAHPASEQ